MSWTLLVGLVLLSGLFWVVFSIRRLELASMARSVAQRDRAIAAGADRAQLQYPVVDLSRCLGCATCVAACPEKGVLEIVHGQATVVGAARCAGVSACERECPTGAITITLGNTDERDDIPALSDELEAVGQPGLYLAGEVTARALIRTAIEHGTSVARRVAGDGSGERVPGERAAGVLDLLVVGAGPAGLACSLEARRLGLNFLTIEQEAHAGGTVAKYPRHKLVLTEPVDLPLVGRLKQRTYEKEELVELWERAVRDARLPLTTNVELESVERDDEGHFVVTTTRGIWIARNVCLALGRRGVVTKLDVPGAALPKVAYDLADASSYRNRNILVVGGGDAAVETALGLSRQPGNAVTLSYRKSELFRVRQRNVEKLQGSLERGELQVLFESEIDAIEDDRVRLRVGSEQRKVLPNDDVFVMAGGRPPIELLKRAGISFDPALRPVEQPAKEVTSGLLPALGMAFALSVVALIWCLAHGDYYLLSDVERPAHAKHDWLRPGRGVGLALGLAAVVALVVNLLYLVRRAPRPTFPVWRFGSLKSWMTSHVATGVLACACALVHASMSVGDSIGGHALLALFALLVTGAIGRWFYAAVPRAANGRELELAEVKKRLSELARHGGPPWCERARREVLELVHRRQWSSSFPGRVRSLVSGQRELGRATRRLAAEGRAAGVEPTRIHETLTLARRAHQTALAAAHFEDLRAALATWRYAHRWLALLMVLLVAIHVGYALIYGAGA